VLSIRFLHGPFHAIRLGADPNLASGFLSEGGEEQRRVWTRKDPTSLATWGLVISSSTPEGPEMNLEQLLVTDDSDGKKCP
jgi:hypothetical protein